jgi:lysophospholipase L1-like esterase
VEVKLSEFYQRYRTKFVPVDPTQDTLFKEQQQKDPDAFFRNSIDHLCSLALSNHVTPVLIYLPTEDEGSRPLQKNLRSAKAQLAQKYNVPFLDLSSNLLGTGKTLFLDADPVHFNVEGNAIIARRLFETITNALPQRSE